MVLYFRVKYYIVNTLTAISLLIVLPSALCAQLSDDFSDGDFSASPGWEGWTDRYIVNAEKELQLFDQYPESENLSFLYLPAPTSIDEETVYECYFRMEFSPSSGNNGRIYLAANSPDLSTDPTGYYLQLGGISGSDDAIELVVEDGSSKTVLITGATGALGIDPAQARVRVTRSTNGLWTLEADYSGGTDFQLEGTAIDNTFSTGSFFGLASIYTSTRNESFFFDDIFIDPLFVDASPPQLLEAVPESANSLRVIFNEPLDPVSAETLTNYFVDAAIGVPTTADLNGISPQEILLTFSNSFQSGFTYNLEVSDVADVALNPLSSATVAFDYFEPVIAEPYDILIHEIMADPTPAIGLPAVEFIELYNASGAAINLQGWSINSGGTPAVFPGYQFPPDSYLIICEPGEEASFSGFGMVIGLEDFPALTNTGDVIGLANEENEVIHVVQYSDEWYRSSEKDDGGWTLEMINPQAPCFGAINWIASESLIGGTPGAPNSVLDPSPDEEGPALLRVFPQDALQLEVQFSEDVDAASASDKANYLIDPPVPIEFVLVDAVQKNIVFLLLQEPLDPSQVYTLRLASTMTDCLGNANGIGNEVRFGLPAIPSIGDLLINEVLFHPEVGGSDYIEIVHTGSFPLALNDLVVGNLGEENPGVVGLAAAELVFPGDYIVLTESPADIEQRYLVADPSRLIQVDLPTFSDPAGNVSLITLNGNGETILLDSFDYSNDLHHPLLDETRGVSLERIRLDDPTSMPSNWHSAAATVGFGTPTSVNSQLQPLTDGVGFQLVHPTLSPDGDGYQDVLLLDYQLDEPGFVANIRIFDSQGRPVRYLADNEILGSSGSFLWAGDTDREDRAPLGIYVIWIEYFHPDGRRMVEKMSCVVAGKLN